MEKYYKSARYINGNVRIVIIDDKGDIIKNPTNEQKDSAVFGHRRKPYNKTGTCDYIKEDGKRCGKKLEPKKACKEYRNGVWTGCVKIVIVKTGILELLRMILIIIIML